MKTTAVLCTCLFLVGDVRANAGIRDIAPANAIFFAEVADAAALQTAVAKTPVGGLVVSDRPAVSVSLAISMGRLFLRTATGVGFDDWLKHLSGSAAVIGFHPRAIGIVSDEPPLVLALGLSGAEVDARAFLDDVRTVVLNNAPYLNHEVIEVAGISVDTFLDTRNQKSFSVSVNRQCLLIGGTKALSSVLQDGPRLSAEVKFKTALENRDQAALMWFYLDVQKLLASVNKDADPEAKKLKDMRMLGLPSLSHVTASVSVADGVTSERITLTPTGIKPLGLAMALLKPGSRPLGGSRVVPATFGFFVNGQLESGEAFHRGVLESVGEILGEKKLQDFENGKNFIANALAINVEQDLFANLNGEVVYALNLPDMKKQLLETAQLTKLKEWDQFLALGINDRNMARGVIKSWLESELAIKQGFLYEIVPAGDDEIFMVRHNDKLFSLGLTQDYFLYSKSADVLKQAMAARKEGTGMDGHDDVRRLAVGDDNALNLFARAGVDWFMKIGTEVLERFANPAVSMAVKELRPGIDRLQAATMTGRNTGTSFVLDVKSSQGVLVHVLGIAALVDAVKKSPGAKVIRARRELRELGEAIDRYYVNNGSFPPTLPALAPKYMERVPSDPFGGSYKYYPGPKTIEDGRDLYLKGWFLLSQGPDRRQDVSFTELDFEKFQNYLVSDQPRHVRYMCQITYQFVPKKHRLEARLLDRGDIYVWGLAPQ